MKDLESSCASGRSSPIRRSTLGCAPSSTRRSRPGVERLRPGVESVVPSCSRRRSRGRIDLIADSPILFPAIVICEMIACARRHRQHQGLVGGDRALPGPCEKAEEVYAAARRNVAAMGEHFRRIIDDHRRRPPRTPEQSDRASEGGERLSEDELIANVHDARLRAHTTTTHLIGTDDRLLRQPRRWRPCAPTLAGVDVRAVEELLRYDGPFSGAPRRARTDRGSRATNRPGEIVFPCASGQPRPAAFPDPDPDLAARETATSPSASARTFARAHRWRDGGADRVRAILPGPR